jgi:peroxiredoxin
MLKDDYPLIREFAATVLAVSVDSLESHRAFGERLGGIPFPLASDADLAVARLYGVADEDSKRCQRAVFVIDQTGMVLHSQPWFQPGTPAQYQAIFEALGLET